MSNLAVKWRWFRAAPRLAREWEAAYHAEGERHNDFLIEMAERKGVLEGGVPPDPGDILQIAKQQHQEIIRRTAHRAPPGVRTPYDRPTET